MDAEITNINAIISTGKETERNKLTEYSRVIGEVIVWLCINHPDVWQKVPLISDDGQVTHATQAWKIKLAN